MCGVVGFLTTSLLQIYLWVCLWKNFENWTIFGEVTGKNAVPSCFCDTRDVNCQLVNAGVWMWAVVTCLAWSQSGVVGVRDRRLWRPTMTCCSVFSSSVAVLLACVPAWCQWHNCIQSLKIGRLQQEKLADSRSFIHFFLTWHAVIHSVTSDKHNFFS